MFVLAFGTASTLVFVLECVPISDFWLALSGGLKSRLRGRCISIHNFLLANGSINTATDILLLTLVRIAYSINGSALTQGEASANTMASESQKSAEMHPYWHLHHRSGVGLLMHPPLAELRVCV